MDLRARRPQPAESSDATALVVVRAMRALRAIVPPRLHGAFTARYVGALATVAVLATVSCLSVSRVVSSESSAAAVVNTSGLQRMLSQRIALEATILTRASGSARTSVRATLANNIEKMAADQRGLLQGDPVLGLPGHPSAAVLALYDGGTAAAVDGYLAMARRLLAAPAGSSTAALVASLQTTALGPLVPDLDQIVLLYQDESEARVAEIKRQEDIVLAVTLLILLVEATLVFRPMTRRIAVETDRLEAASERFRTEAERHGFSLRLRNAFDLADNEADVAATVSTAVAEIGAPGELDLILVQDDGEMHGVAAGCAHACGVVTTGGCPALRQGKAMHFGHSDRLGACGQLRRDAADAGGGPVCSTCVPLTFLGQGMGVLRNVGPPVDTVEDRTWESLEAIAMTAGTHLGTLRAIAKSRSDAESDPLTGLLNRRGLEHAVARMDRQEVPYVAIAADLDHFKAVNDAHGHEIGDSVLIETARAMGAALRPGDTLARTGGEEFVVVVPLKPGETGADGLAAGVVVAERVQASLTAARELADVPMCSASFGVAERVPGDLAATLRRVDAALYRAKAFGRDRVEISGQLVAERSVAGLPVYP